MGRASELQRKGTQSSPLPGGHLSRVAVRATCLCTEISVLCGHPPAQLCTSSCLHSECCLHRGSRDLLLFGKAGLNSVNHQTGVNSTPRSAKPIAMHCGSRRRLEGGDNTALGYTLYISWERAPCSKFTRTVQMQKAQRKYSSARWCDVSAWAGTHYTMPQQGNPH